MNPRPALGAAAKTEVVCVRLTQAEKDALVARYGDVTRALRVLISTVVKVKT